MVELEECEHHDPITCTCTYEGHDVPTYATGCAREGLYRVKQHTEEERS